MHIVDILVRWGRSQALSRANTGFPRQTPFARLAHERWAGLRGNQVECLDDDTHVLVDRAVSQIKVRDHDAWRSLCLCYIERKPDAVIGRRLKVSRQQATAIRQRAEHKLESMLEEPKHSGVNTQ